MIFPCVFISLSTVVTTQLVGILTRQTQESKAGHVTWHGNNPRNQLALEKKRKKIFNLAVIDLFLNECKQNVTKSVVNRDVRPGPGGIMDIQRRTGEKGTAPFRSSRYFCVGGKWYFTTREGFDSGPFASRERAETGLKRFLHVVKLLPAEQRVH